MSRFERHPLVRLLLCCAAACSAAYWLIGPSALYAFPVLAALALYAYWRPWQPPPLDKEQL